MHVPPLRSSTIRPGPRRPVPRNRCAHTRWPSRHRSWCSHGSACTRALVTILRWAQYSWGYPWCAAMRYAGCSRRSANGSLGQLCGRSCHCVQGGECLLQDGQYLCFVRAIRYENLASENLRSASNPNYRPGLIVRAGWSISECHTRLMR